MEQRGSGSHISGLGVWVVEVITVGVSAGGLRRISAGRISIVTNRKKGAHSLHFVTIGPVQGTATESNQIKSNRINNFDSKLTWIDPFESHFLFLGPRTEAK